MSSNTVPKDTNMDHPDSNTPALDDPKCGLNGKECKDSVADPKNQFAVAMGSCTVGLLVLLSLFFVCRMSKRKTAGNCIWNVEAKRLSSIKPCEHSEGDDSLVLEARKISLMSDVNVGREGQLYMDSVLPVSLHGISPYDLRKDPFFQKRLSQLLSIKNSNLTVFYGVCVKHSLLQGIWENCPNYSLSEVISAWNEKSFNIDNMVQYSLARDVCAGLKYLHSTDIKVHGDLTSGTCYVDEHWTCKLSCFGLKQFHEHRKYRVKEFDRALFKAADFFVETDSASSPADFQCNMPKEGSCDWSAVNFASASLARSDPETLRESTLSQPLTVHSEPSASTTVQACPTSADPTTSLHPESITPATLMPPLLSSLPAMLRPPAWFSASAPSKLHRDSCVTVDSQKSKPTIGLAMFKLWLPNSVQSDSDSDTVLDDPTDEKSKLKVTVSALAQKEPLKKSRSAIDYIQLYWYAPELLRQMFRGDAMSLTQEADVYAAAIIMKELFTRETPYYHELQKSTPEEVIKKVANYSWVGSPFRPMIPDPPPSVQKVMPVIKSCWDEVPSYRPTAKNLFRQLRRVNAHREMGSITSSLLKAMNTYSSKLEDLVAERTRELAEEKRRTEILLYQMLPPPVANALKRGRAAQAEAFDSVTIYFSDIVGFTAIASACRPIQIVQFLNALYILFDTTVSNYNVYKVETIGDAYMVVSGLPLPNPDHAFAIADMSLALHWAVDGFVLPHDPSTHVRVRIGINTGPVVAGVVGKTMPRYCLFGDTVNVASRMESTGLPNEIHISHTTHAILNHNRLYVFEARGPIQVKGKGMMETYFLKRKKMKAWEA